MTRPREIDLQYLPIQKEQSLKSVILKDAWIERAIRAPLREIRQADGRIRRWIQVSEMENRYLRVILLEDGETVHNAFFDRGFVP